jgi:hypothetical protein
MSNYWGKQPSSRVLLNQTIQYLGDKASYATSAFSAQTYQLRTVAQVAGYVNFDSSTVTSTPGSGTIVNANTVDFWTVTPGSFLAYTSSSTSSGAVTLTEMC